MPALYISGCHDETYVLIRNRRDVGRRGDRYRRMRIEADLASQCRSCAFAVLFKGGVERTDVRIGSVTYLQDSKATGQCIATATLTRNIQPGLAGIIEWISCSSGIGADGQRL